MHAAASRNDAASIVRYERAPRTQTHVQTFRDALSATKQVRPVIAEVAKAFVNYPEVPCSERPKSTADHWFMGTYLLAGGAAVLPIMVNLPGTPGVHTAAFAFMLAALAGGVVAALPAAIASKLHTRAVARHEADYASRRAASYAERTPITLDTIRPLITHLKNASNDTQAECIRAQYYGFASGWDRLIGNERLVRPELCTEARAVLENWTQNYRMPRDPAARIGWIAGQAKPLQYFIEFAAAFNALESEHAAVADAARAELGDLLTKKYGKYETGAGEMVAALDRASMRRVV